MNPFFLAYNSVVNVVEYAAPTAVIVSGRTNRVAPEFQIAREKGAEVYEYYNLIDIPNVRVSAIDDQFYMGDRSRVPLWGNGRTNWAGSAMGDTRVGSAWFEYALSFLAARMESNEVDGVFLDVVGGRLWSKLANWTSWPQQEQADWQNGMVEFVRRLDSARKQINPEFVIVNNNSWQFAEPGEQYVNGICIENHNPVTNLYIVNYANRTFGAPDKRRVLTISSTPALAAAWSKIAGVTHVANTEGVGYGAPGPAAVGYQDLRYAELLPAVARLKAQLASEAAEYESTIQEYESAIQWQNNIIRSQADTIDSVRQAVDCYDD